MIYRLHVSSWVVGLSLLAGPLASAQAPSPAGATPRDSAVRAKEKAASLKAQNDLNISGILVEHDGSSAQAEIVSMKLSPGASLPWLSRSSPVELFRSLIHASKGDRLKLLNDKSESQRKYILSKVEEYESLSREEQEFRMRAMQLRWYLLPLMKLNSTNRVVALATIPVEDRKLLRERLEEWDRLSPDLRKDIIRHEEAMHYFARLEGVSAEERERIMQKFPPERRRELEQGIAAYKALPEARREDMIGRFQRFFELTPKEKDRVLESVSDNDRKQMEKTLEAFSTLPADQRKVVVRSFQKFATMSPEERTVFLKNAERWKSMTQTERKIWRDLDTQLPPVPPGMFIVPMPPMPVIRPSAITASPVPAPQPKQDEVQPGR